METEPMTAEQRAKHYMLWHQAAYGAPAPHDEVVSQLQMRNGLTNECAESLLENMAMNGQITKHGESWRVAARRGVFGV